MIRLTLPDGTSWPTLESIDDAESRLRYGDHPDLAAAAALSALRYLLAVAPTTEIAVKKLRMWRRAVGKEVTP